MISSPATDDRTRRLRDTIAAITATPTHSIDDHLQRDLAAAKFSAFSASVASHHAHGGLGGDAAGGDPISDLKAPESRKVITGSPRFDPVSVGLKDLAKMTGASGKSSPKRSPSIRIRSPEPAKTHHNEDSEARAALIQSLDKKIRDLEERFRSAEADNRTLRERNEKLTRENAVLGDYESRIKLHEDESTLLRNRLDILLRENATLRTPPTTNSKFAQVTTEEWSELNERVDLLLKENDVLVEQSRGARREIGELREE
ncbi:hypothetical protein HK102_009142, partial [Quaeritorhiza haematococci]